MHGTTSEHVGAHAPNFRHWNVSIRACAQGLMAPPPSDCATAEHRTSPPLREEWPVAAYDTVTRRALGGGGRRARQAAGAEIARQTESGVAGAADPAR